MTIDPLQKFSWWIYGGVVIVYTALVLYRGLEKAGSHSIEFGTRSLSSRLLVSVHGLFLAILLLMMSMGPYIYPNLPGWMTSMFIVRNSSISIFDVIYIVTMGVLCLIERRWIYSSSERTITKSDED